MTYKIARVILDLQDRDLRKIRDIRIFRDGLEFRVNYRGGFASYIAIDYRKVGKRYFDYFAGASGAHCTNVGQAMDLVNQKIDEKMKKGA